MSLNSIMSTFSGGGGGGSPTGPAGGDLAGTYPNPILVPFGPGAGIYGDAAHYCILTLDTKGRVQAITLQAFPGGVTNHSLLSNLTYAAAGHTGFEPTVTKGNLTATLPVTVSGARQVIGGAADIAIDSFAGGVPGAVPNSLGGVVNYLRADGSWEAPPGVGGAPHDLLSATHPDTLSGGPVRGDLIRGNATPKWERLAKGSTNYILKAGASDVAWDALLGIGALSAPGGDRILFYDDTAGTVEFLVPSTGLSISGTTLTASQALLSATHTDTLADSVVKGDVVVGNATPKWSRLLANATGIKKYLQSYSGGVPSWEQVDYGDLSGSDPYWGYIRRYGFVNRSTTTLAFNDGTYELTLAPTGSSWAYMRYGVVHVIAGSKTVTLAGAPPAAGLYYVYIDSTNGTLIADTVGWDLNDTKVPVCYLWWDDTKTPKYWLGEERHECIVDRGWHREHHFAEGTEWLSGAVLVGYTVNPPGPVDTDNTFSISQMSMVDEDIFLTLAALADPGGVANAYVNIYLAGGSWTWEGSPVPLKYSGAGYIQYDNAGVMTAGSSANFYNTYLYASNFDGMARWSIVSGKAQFSSLANAQAEDPLTFNFSGFPAQEGIVLYQLTWRTSNSYGTLGKCRLAAAPKKIKITLTGTVGGGTPIHNSLPGLQGGVYPSEYYHLGAYPYGTLSGGVGGTDKMVQYNDNMVLSGASTFAWDKINERVGIGTLVPAQRLDIQGAGTQRLTITETGSTVTCAMKASTTSGFLGTTTNHPLGFQVNNTTFANLVANGHLLLANPATGILTPGIVFHVAEISTLAGAVTDAYVAAHRLTPLFTGGYSVTRQNYLDINNPTLAGGAVCVDAPVLRFDAAAATHKSLVDDSANSGYRFIKVNENGTLRYVPMQTAVGPAPFQQGVGPMYDTARVYRNSTQTINNGAATAVTFSTLIYDSNTLWAVGAPTRLTAKVAGIYHVGGQVVFDANNTGKRTIEIRKTAGTPAVVFNDLNPNPGCQGLACHGMINMGVGDYIECFVYHNITGGGTLNLLTGTTYPSMWMELCRPDYQQNTSVVQLNAVRVVRATDQAMNDAAYTDISFSSATYNYGTMWVIGAPTLITATVAGVYVACGSMLWAAHATGVRNLVIKKNGVIISGMGDTNLANATYRQVVATEISLAVGDYLTLAGYQNSGGALNCTASDTGNIPNFSVALIRPDNALAPAAAKLDSVRITRSTDQTIGTGGAITAVSFDAATYSLGNALWVVGTPTRVTIVTPGVYLMCGAVRWANNATGTRSICFRIGGVTAFGEDIRTAHAADSVGNVNSAMYKLAAGNYIEMCVWQDSGGNLAAQGSVVPLQLEVILLRPD